MTYAQDVKQQPEILFVNKKIRDIVTIIENWHRKSKQLKYTT